MSDRDLRIRVLMEGADRLTRPMRDAAAGSSRLAQTLKATRDQIKGLDRAQSQLAGFRQLKTELGQTEQKMAAARARATQLGRELAQTANPTKRLRAEFDRARRDVSQLSAQMERQQSQLRASRAALTEAGVSTRNLASEERRLRAETARANDSLREQERRLTEVADRERRMANARVRVSRIQGAATGLATGGMASIGTGMALGAPLQGAADDAMQFESVMTDINQKVNQSREAGRLMGMDLRRAALSVNQFPADLQKGVDTLTGFGLGARQAVDMMSPIGKAATSYKAEIDDLARATFAANDNLRVPIEKTGKALDVMAQAGKSGAFEVKDMAQYFPELTANMQSLKSTGIPAVADLAAALQIVRKGAGDSAGAATNLTNLLSKINAGDTIKNFKKFGIDVPAAMKKAAKEGRSPIEEIVRLTQKATGGDQAKLSSLFGDMQVQQALRPLMSNLKAYQDIRAEALGAAGTVDTDFADRMKDSAEKVKHARIQTKDLALVIGDQLKPVISSVSDTMSSWGEQLSIMAQRHPTLTKGIALTAAGFAALFLVVGAGAIVLAGILAPFAALSGAAALLGTTSTAMLLGFGKALLVPLRILPLLGKGAMMLATGVARAAMLMLANPMVLAITALVAAVALAGYLIWKHWDRISAAFKGGMAVLSGLAPQFRQFGANMIDGLIGGIIGRLSALKSTIVGAATSAATWFKEKLGIHSPSRVFEGLGGFVMAGLDQGLDRNSDGPLARIANLADGMARTMGRPIDAPTSPDLIDRMTGISATFTKALARGAMMPAIAAAAPAAAQAPASVDALSSRAAAPTHYTIDINVAGGAQAQDIADQVREAIEQIERERRGRTFEDD